MEHLGNEIKWNNKSLTNYPKNCHGYAKTWLVLLTKKSDVNL